MSFQKNFVKTKQFQEVISKDFTWIHRLFKHGTKMRFKLLCVFTIAASSFLITQFPNLKIELLLKLPVKTPNFQILNQYFCTLDFLLVHQNCFLRECTKKLEAYFNSLLKKHVISRKLLWNHLLKLLWIYEILRIFVRSRKPFWFLFNSQWSHKVKQKIILCYKK